MGGFSMPGGLADRLPSGFPPFGQRQQQENETGALSTSWPCVARRGVVRLRSSLSVLLLPRALAVWSAPTQQPASYQPRFSIDEEASTGSATPPHPQAPASTIGGKKSGAAPAAAAKAPQAEGGGYHSLE